MSRLLSAGPLMTRFILYTSQFNKSYKDQDEFDKRFKQFVTTDTALNEINAAGGTEVVGHNFLSDWFPEERA